MVAFCCWKAYWPFKKLFLFLSCQRSASLSVVGFSKSLEMELPSTRSSSSADPQMQGAAAITLGLSPNALCDCDTAPESIPSSSLTLGRAPSDLSPRVTADLAPGDALQGSTKCKVRITQIPLLKGNLLSLIAHVIVRQSKAAISVSEFFLIWYLKTDYKLFS